PATPDLWQPCTPRRSDDETSLACPPGAVVPVAEPGAGACASGPSGALARCERAAPGARRSRGGLRACRAADALFLPAVALRSSCRDPCHWANPEVGWRPCARRSGAPGAAPSRGPECRGEAPPGARTEAGDLWAERACRRRRDKEKRRAGALEAAECHRAPQPLSSDGDGDDVPAQCLLSPEESQAKRDLYNELNKHFLECWDHEDRARRQKEAARRSRQARQQAAEKRKAWVEHGAPGGPPRRRRRLAAAAAGHGAAGAPAALPWPAAAAPPARGAAE
ncbi:unnamed protein product, partial [Prorocentrum cordatum]